MIFREGFQNEDFVAFYNGNKFYTGPLDSNFTEALYRLISLRALAFGDIVEYLESIGVSDVNIDDTFDVASTFSKALFYDDADGEDYWNFYGFEIFPEYELSESMRRKKSIKEYIDNSDTIEFLENAFEKLRYHSKNLNKTQYYLFSIAYDSFQEYRNGNGTERDIYKKCREFAEYCQTHNKNLTKMQDSLVDDILSNT